MDAADDMRPMFGFPVARWHGWFAWRPVKTVDAGWCWLRRVYRRRCQIHHYLPGPTIIWWQYRRLAPGRAALEAGGAK